MEPTRYPDLTVDKVDGEWQVNLSHPLSGRYRYRETKIPRKNALEKELVEPSDDPAETLRRLRAMRQDARMLVRATEYRDRTLFEIGTTLVREQSEFVERGEEALKPLLQKELAEKLGLNEATVSRILKDKFILTPRGLIPLSALLLPLPHQPARREGLQQVDHGRALPAHRRGREPGKPLERPGALRHPQAARHPHQPADGDQVPDDPEDRRGRRPQGAEEDSGFDVGAATDEGSTSPSPRGPYRRDGSPDDVRHASLSALVRRISLSTNRLPHFGKASIVT